MHVSDKVRRTSTVSGKHLPEIIDLNTRADFLHVDHVDDNRVYAEQLCKSSTQVSEATWVAIGRGFKFGIRIVL